MSGYNPSPPTVHVAQGRRPFTEAVQAPLQASRHLHDLHTLLEELSLNGECAGMVQSLIAAGATLTQATLRITQHIKTSPSAQVRVAQAAALTGPSCVQRYLSIMHKSASVYIFSVLRRLADTSHYRLIDFDQIWNAPDDGGPAVSYADMLLLNRFRDTLVLAGRGRRGAPHNLHPAVIRDVPHRIVYVARDPRDAVISLYFSKKYSHPLMAAKHADDRDKLQRLTKEDGLTMTIDIFEKNMAPSVCEWFEYKKAHAVLIMQYEKLVADPAAFFTKMLDYFALNYETETLNSLLDEFNFEKITNRKSGEQDIHSHYRKGIAGDWQNHFTEQHLDYFSSKECCRKALEAYAGLTEEAPEFQRAATRSGRCMDISPGSLKAAPLLINSVPKSGTHLLEKVVKLLRGITPAHVPLTYKTSAELVDRDDRGPADIPVGVGRPRFISQAAMRRFLQGLQSGSYVTGHLPYSEPLDRLLQEAGIQTLLIFRDPRDVVISHVNYMASTPDHPLFGLYRSLPEHERIMRSITGFPRSEADGEIRLSIAQRYQSMVPWMTRPYSYTTTFEQLVGPQGGGIRESQISELDSIARHLHITCSRDEIERIADSLFGGTGTFNKGVIGRWRTFFTQAHKDVFKNTAGRLLIELGYEKDFDW